MLDRMHMRMAVPLSAHPHTLHCMHAQCSHVRAREVCVCVCGGGVGGGGECLLGCACTHIHTCARPFGAHTTQQGRIRSEGKAYVMKENDIAHFLVSC